MIRRFVPPHDAIPLTSHLLDTFRIITEPFPRAGVFFSWIWGREPLGNYHSLAKENLFCIAHNIRSSLAGFPPVVPVTDGAFLAKGAFYQQSGHSAFDLIAINPHLSAMGARSPNPNPGINVSETHPTIWSSSLPSYQNQLSYRHTFIIPSDTTVRPSHVSLRHGQPPPPFHRLPPLHRPAVDIDSPRPLYPSKCSSTSWASSPQILAYMDKNTALLNEGPALHHDDVGTGYPQAAGLVLPLAQVQMSRPQNLETTGVESSTTPLDMTSTLEEELMVDAHLLSSSQPSPLSHQGWTQRDEVEGSPHLVACPFLLPGTAFHIDSLKLHLVFWLDPIIAVRLEELIHVSYSNL